MKFLLFLLAFGCVVEHTPNVRVIGEPVMSDAVNQWHRLGYLAGCAPEENCLVIVVERWPMLKERYGIYAMVDVPGRLVVIDSRFTNYYDLLTMGTHEMGHILLDSGHLPPGQIGVMSASGALWIPTDADYALACETIGICI